MRLRYQLLTTLTAAMLLLSSMASAGGYPAFVLHQHSRTKGPRGDKVVQTIVISQLVDGSRAIQTFDLARGMDDRKIIHADGLVQQAYDKIKVVSSTRETSPEYLVHKGSLFDPATDCLVPYTGTLHSPYKLLGQEMLGVVPVNKILAGENSGLILWAAPSLGCVALKNQMTFSDSVSTLEMDSIALTDPDPSVFTVAKDYEELIPSQAKFRLLKSATISIPEPAIDSIVSRMSREDANYASKRP